MIQHLPAFNFHLRRGISCLLSSPSLLSTVADPSSLLFPKLPDRETFLLHLINLLFGLSPKPPRATFPLPLSHCKSILRRRRPPLFVSPIQTGHSLRQIVEFHVHDPELAPQSLCLCLPSLSRVTSDVFFLQWDSLKVWSLLSQVYLTSLSSDSSLCLSNSSSPLLSLDPICSPTISATFCSSLNRSSPTLLHATVVVIG